jgi:hypothetical protein
MSRTPAPATPFADTEIVICLMSYATGPYAVVRAGSRLRGNHPSVLKNPEFFAVDGSTDGERAAAVRALSPVGTPTDVGPAHPVTLSKPLPDEDASLCITACGGRGIGAGGHPRGASVGMKVRTASPLVRDHAECFVSVCRGVERSRALVYRGREEMRGRTFPNGEDGDPVDDVLRPGQWVDVADRRAVDHAVFFSRPDPQGV